MGEEYSVAEMWRQLGDLRVQVGRIEATTDANHKQNRSDIHDIRGFLDAIMAKIELLAAKITGIEMKNARWNIAAGVITAVLLKGLDYLIKGH